MSKLDLSSLARMTSTLRALPKVLAQQIATKAAPALSEFANESFESSRTPYGVPWLPKVDGDRATLDKTGALKRFVYYVAIGTKLRVALGVPYAKYQIGKRPLFPRQGGLLPAKYSAKLQQITQETARDFVQKGGA